MVRKKHSQVSENLHKFLHWLFRILSFFKKSKPDFSVDNEIKSLQKKVDKTLETLETVASERFKAFEELTQLQEKAEEIKAAYLEAKSRDPKNTQKLDDIKKKFQKCHEEVSKATKQNEKLTSKMEYLQQEIEMLNFKIHARMRAFTMDMVREQAKIDKGFSRRIGRSDAPDAEILAELEKLVPYDAAADRSSEPDEDAEYLAELENKYELQSQRAEQDFQELEKFYALPVEQQLVIKKRELEKHYRRFGSEAQADAPKSGADTQLMRRLEREDKNLEAEMLQKSSRKSSHK